MRETGLDALIRACKYSAIPNELGFCGPKNAFPKLHSFIESPSAEKAEEVKALLRQFSALFPYLELIASSNSREPFDGEVVEAYWIGNSLLANVRHRGLQKTILSFQKFGLPKEIAEKKASLLPEGVLPHHSFHVLYVNFINPKVKPLVQNLSNCLVQWAEVKRKTSKGFKVKGIELFAEASELKLKEKVKSVENPFSLELKKGNLVSVHWGKAIESLSTEQFKNLREYTFRTLKTINEI